MVERVAQTSEPHLLVDPPHTLAAFDAEAEVGADPGDPRVAGEPRDPCRIGQVDEPREPAWALDLDAVIGQSNTVFTLPWSGSDRIIPGRTL